MILIKFGQYINEMMAVAVENFQNFFWSRFLIIRQNVNMATNAILNCGLTSSARSDVRVTSSVISRSCLPQVRFIDKHPRPSLILAL